MTGYEPYKVDYHTIYLVKVVSVSNNESWYADKIGRLYEAKRNYIYEWDHNRGEYNISGTVFNAIYGYIAVYDAQVIKEYKSVIPPEQNN